MKMKLSAIMDTNPNKIKKFANKIASKVSKFIKKEADKLTGGIISGGKKAFDASKKFFKDVGGAISDVGKSIVKAFGGGKKKKKSVE